MQLFLLLIIHFLQIYDFNYENNEVVESSINFKDLIREKTFEQLTTIKAALSAVKVGSVLEIKYTIHSNNFAISDWYFQYDEIPVKYSEFSIYLPEYVHYHINQKGYESINTHYSKKFTPKHAYGTNFGATGMNLYKYNWYSEDIPAFKSEEYMTTTNDYKSRVEFELSYLNWLGYVYHDRASSWAEIDTDLSESFYFGKKTNESLFLKNKIDTLIDDSMSKYDKMIIIYEFIKNELDWTGYNTQYSYKTYREIFNKKRGNSSGEINLALISVLKSSGIFTEPVILSTRDNGKIFPVNPTIEKFNYVIAKSTIDGNVYYLDATEKLLAAGLLPKRCFNGTCRIIRKDISGELFELKPVAADKSISMYILSIDENSITGSVQKSYNDYSAFNKRKEIEEIGNTDDYTKHKIKISTKENITDYKIEDFEDIYKPVKESYKISTTDNITFAGDMIYLTPLLNERMTENPFKLEERKYPVDYAYPISKKIIIQYTIPEGYEIAEIPESINIVLPGKAASFQFQVSSVGNMVQVINNFKINQPVFQYDLYPALKNFYNIVIEKQNQKIVFKKKA